MGLDSRSARTKALRLSLAAQHFLPWLMILPMNGYIPCRKKLFNHLVSQRENIKSVGTFLFDSTLKKDLSPASLTLLLPSFLREQKGTLSVKMFSEKAVPVRKDP